MSPPIRNRIAEIGGEFSSENFKELKHITSLLSKMEARGEIRCVRRCKNSKGAARKVYVVIKLKEFKPRMVKVEKVDRPVIARKPPRKEDVVISNWMQAFPHWFAMPVIKECGKTVVKEIIE